MERSIRTLVQTITQWITLFLKLLLRPPNHRFSKPVSTLPLNKTTRRPPKPPWVRQEVMRLKALMPKEGCRKVAHTFNRLHGEKRKMTVGKSYVYNIIKQHLYEIQVLRKNIKHRKPKPLPKNLIWSMDLTQVRDSTGQAHTLFGLVDGGTRACLTLKAIPNKASITLLRILLNTVEQYGIPKIIRTDNESVFISRLFRLSLFMLGIKHQRTEKCCPWMNGKIERFFGTLKNKLQYHAISNVASLTQDINLFRSWYNHIRPHQHLEGKAPAEVWDKKIPNKKGKAHYFCAWNGALAGFYLPP